MGTKTELERLRAENHLLQQLWVTVNLSCNPPDDCDDPTVLKEYMRACMKKADEYERLTKEWQMSKPDIECTNCQWQGFQDNDTPEGGLLRIYKGDKGWDAYDPIDDPDDDGIWVCPKCFLPEDGGIMSI